MTHTATEPVVMTTNNAREQVSSRLDETDKLIIQHLQADGRMPYTRLGPLVGLSAPATRQRVLALIESGVMQVVAVTDPTTLGFEVQAMLGVKIRGDLGLVSSAVAGFAEVDYVVVTTGRFDMLLEIVCEHNAHLLELVNRIRLLDGVTEVEVFSYIQLVKQTYDWGTR
jgi:Lrp/AsnC family transcriptional regulator for asnA, asnC and gidA